MQWRGEAPSEPGHSHCRLGPGLVLPRNRTPKCRRELFGTSQSSGIVAFPCSLNEHPRLRPPERVTAEAGGSISALEMRSDRRVRGDGPKTSVKQSSMAAVRQDLI